MCTGIIGNSCLHHPSKYLEKSIDEMYRSKYCFEIENHEVCENIALYSIYTGGMMVRKGNLVVAFDGYIFDIGKKRETIIKKIMDLYQTVGPTFPKLLRGSFQIVIIENIGLEDQEIYLYSDQNCSRPIFYGVSDSILYFGPQISSVSIHIKNKQVYWPSVVQFLIGGCFFTGTTIIEQVRILRSGEYLRFKGNKYELNYYYEYNAKNYDGNYEYRDSKKILSKALKKSILDSWSDAKEPGILLSGGYDSRYIFYTIAEAVNDTSKLKTVTWGQQLGAERSDGQVAKSIARKYGTKHIEIEKNADNIISEFQEAFKAQSGMADSSFYHANELTVCGELREKYGVCSLFRGEQPYGAKRRVFNVQNALATMGMSLARYVKEIDCWFSDNYKIKILNGFSSTLEEELSKCQGSANDLKDTFYHNHRLTMALQPTNYFKYHFQEIYNPLIDPKVLNIVSNLPDWCRVHKRIFKDCLNDDFPDERNTPIAKLTNLINWDLEVQRNELIKTFLLLSIKQLPDIFEKEYFLNLLEAKRLSAKDKYSVKLVKTLYSIIKQCLPGKEKQIIKDLSRVRPQKIKVKDCFLLIRIAVLSKWIYELPQQAIK